VKQEVPETLPDDSRIHNESLLRANGSSPMLDPSNLLGDGRACYDLKYVNPAYSTYDDHAGFQVLSKQDHYVVSPYTEGHSSNDLGPSASLSVSSLYPERQELLR